MMKKARPLISIVDDDESIREALPDLIEAFGFSAKVFVSAEAFLASPALARTACLILDVAMPGMSGWDLQQTLARMKSEIPIVFITAQGDETMRRRALQAGAVDYLPKPFSDDALLHALKRALGRA
jgi:FixJ family two-component response regulator